MSNSVYEAIVIGASAGGLQALSCLFELLPADFSIPVIAVQHRSKDSKTLLEELLQSKCRIKIKQADEKETIHGGQVFIAPPDYHLLIEKDFTFSLASDEPVLFSRPSIDVLFETAAEVYKNKLIGIILTGTSSDGVSGIQAIRRHNGLTIVQDPEEAQYPLMPRSVIENARVDYVFTLSQLGSFLLKINSDSDGEKR